MDKKAESKYIKCYICKRNTQIKIKGWELLSNIPKDKVPCWKCVEKGDAE